MDHSYAIGIFKEIQARPYGLCLSPGVPANNCFFKGTELLRKLGTLGYTVRGRVCDTYWDKNILPAAAVDLLPTHMPCTHFFTEVMVDGEWTIADASLQPSMAKHGFTIGSFGKGGESCFPVTKLYSPEETIACTKDWDDPAYTKNLYAEWVAGWSAIN